MKKFKELREASNPAQQAAIAINMKKQGKMPKKMSEEIELDEVSKSTLGKYVNKARSDRMDALHSSYRNADDNYEADEKDNKRVEKRDRGINLARAKINKFGKSGNTIAKVKATESVEEGIMNAVKNLASKASKALTGGSDEDQRKDLQRKMGVPQTGKKPMQK